MSSMKTRRVHHGSVISAFLDYNGEIPIEMRLDPLRRLGDRKGFILRSRVDLQKAIIGTSQPVSEDRLQDAILSLILDHVKVIQMSGRLDVKIKIVPVGDKRGWYRYESAISDFRNILSGSVTLTKPGGHFSIKAPGLKDFDVSVGEGIHSAAPGIPELKMLSRNRPGMVLPYLSEAIGANGRGLLAMPFSTGVDEDDLGEVMEIDDLGSIAIDTDAEAELSEIVADADPYPEDEATTPKVILAKSDNISQELPWYKEDRPLAIYLGILVSALIAFLIQVS